MGISRELFRHLSPASAETSHLFQDAKAALEIQDQILQKAEINKSDEQWLKEVVTGLATSTKDFQAMVIWVDL